MVRIGMLYSSGNTKPMNDATVTGKKYCQKILTVDWI